MVNSTVANVRVCVHRKPKQLKDVAAGANPPFLLFNGEELTDVQKCEDFIEAELYPPRYPKLSCRHQESNTVGMDVFAKFSALIKFTGQTNDPKRKCEFSSGRLLSSFAQFTCNKCCQNVGRLFEFRCGVSTLTVGLMENRFEALF